MVYGSYGLSLGAYFGAALNTSLSTSTNLVPSIFPIAIDGKPYNLDFNNPSGGNFYRRDSVALLRTQADNARVAGESSVSPEIFWRRSFDSWYAGAGQTHADRGTSNPYRFRDSKGMDVWTKGELKSLNDVASQNPASPNENIGLVVAGSRLYAFNGILSYFTAETDSSWAWTTVTGTPANAPVGIASDGKNIWIAHTDAIYKTDTSTSAAASFSTAPATHTWTGVWYNKGKLFASANDSKMYEIDASGGKHLVVDKSTLGFTWSASTGVGGYHYFAGFNGDKSLIFKATLTAEGARVTTPIVAGELPDDEKVLHLNSYLGYLIIGTSKGVRFASTDNEGYITIGGLIETGQPVRCSEGQDRFVWYGHGNYDAVSSGLGRMDLAEFTAVLTPAFASDLMAGKPALKTAATTFTISNKALTSNVATLTTSVAHSLIVGDSIAVTGVDATFNGTYTITVTSSTTFSYAKTNANVASTSSSGAVVVNPIPADPILGDVMSVVTYDNKRVFAVKAGGIFTEIDTKVPQAILNTGLISHGIIDNKFAAFLDARMEPLTANNVLQLSYAADSGAVESSGSIQSVGSTYTGEFFIGEVGRNFEVRISFGNITPSVLIGSDVTCTGFMLRSYPAPKRISKFTVPVMLFDSVNVADRDFAGNPGADFEFLLNLHKSQLPFTYQEGEISYTVVMDDFQWLPEKRSNVSGFQGTFVAVLRELL